MYQKVSRDEYEQITTELNFVELRTGLSRSKDDRIFGSVAGCGVMVFVIYNDEYIAASVFVPNCTIVACDIDGKTKYALKSLEQSKDDDNLYREFDVPGLRIAKPSYMAEAVKGILANVSAPITNAHAGDDEEEEACVPPDVEDEDDDEPMDGAPIDAYNAKLENLVAMGPVNPISVPNPQDLPPASDVIDEDIAKAKEEILEANQIVEPPKDKPFISQGRQLTNGQQVKEEPPARTIDIRKDEARPKPNNNNQQNNFTHHNFNNNNQHQQNNNNNHRNFNNNGNRNNNGGYVRPAAKQDQKNLFGKFR